MDRAASTLFDEGNRLMAEGDRAGAEACFRTLVAEAPELAAPHANLALLLEARGNVAEAEACYRRSIALDAGRFETHSNLGGLLAAQKRFDEAEAAYREALAIDPESRAAWSNLGVLYACMKQEPRAEACFHIAIEIDEHDPGARFNLSYLLLRQGRFEEGWARLEVRDWYAPLARHLACPRWRGESLEGRSLLIGYEAGHGDMIQFCRYAAVLKARGASRIMLLCHPALKRLFASLEAVDEVMAFDEDIPSAAWDCWTPPMSIPHWCGTRVDSIPAPIPYLHAEPALVERWKTALPREGLRVGLVWRGNPAFENDAERSIFDLSLLAPLGRVAGVSLVSLQKGAGEDDARQPPAGMTLCDIGSQLNDFADAAAVMASLDLVISVDTAMAHLAGATGTPCWVMLPDYRTDWRWLHERSDSPWYPQGMRLFRQSANGGWHDVIDAVCIALSRFTANRA